MSYPHWIRVASPITHDRVTMPVRYRQSRRLTLATMLRMTDWLRRQHPGRWIGSREICEHFNLGLKQTWRYMRIIGEVVPMDRERYQNQIQYRVSRSC